MGLRIIEDPVYSKPVIKGGRQGGPQRRGKGRTAERTLKSESEKDSLDGAGGIEKNLLASLCERGK